MKTIIQINEKVNLQFYETLKKKKSSYSYMFLLMNEFKMTIVNPYHKVIPLVALNIYNSFTWDIKNIEIAQLLFLEFKNFIKTWRRIKNYPINGQSTHTNSKMVRKNKILLNFRVNQFFQLFGIKKRNIYPTLIIAEYTNKLWCEIWLIEWLEARQYVLSLIKPKAKILFFDPVNLAKNITTGYTRYGAAAKVGKKKKNLNTATIGLPIFFSRFLYYKDIPRGFPVKLNLTDEDRRKMGKKSKKNLKKKK
uniref:30S ribosomal protein S13 n=1 Tax=Thuricola similis TaxID=2784598 RepID=A0A7T8JJW8_9CILI|nr:30S ribosomal protein S13 [Thuricola similis]QQP22150.1 30S ribosomal protein S13 [Thuricola similis]